MNLALEEVMTAEFNELVRLSPLSKISGFPGLKRDVDVLMLQRGEIQTRAREESFVHLAKTHDLLHHHANLLREASTELKSVLVPGVPRDLSSGYGRILEHYHRHFFEGVERTPRQPSVEWAHHLLIEPRVEALGEAESRKKIFEGVASKLMEQRQGINNHLNRMRQFHEWSQERTVLQKMSPLSGETDQEMEKIRQNFRRRRFFQVPSEQNAIMTRDELGKAHLSLRQKHQVTQEDEEMIQLGKHVMAVWENHQWVWSFPPHGIPPIEYHIPIESFGFQPPALIRIPQATWDRLYNPILSDDLVRVTSQLGELPFSSTNLNPIGDYLFRAGTDRGQAWRSATARIGVELQGGAAVP